MSNLSTLNMTRRLVDRLNREHDAALNVRGGWRLARVLDSVLGALEALIVALEQ